MQPSSKTYFITGASSGFGRAYAELAIAQGHHVIVAARRREKLEEIVQRAPDRVLAVALDVTDHVQIDRAMNDALARFGRIDVLFNNAGYGIVGAVEETPDKELRAQMDTNFFGAVAMMHAVLPVMRKQKSGAIVTTSSMGGQMSMAGFSAYSASKFALEGVCEALAQEVKAFNIKVMIIEPGEFRTGFAGDALKHMPSIPAYEASVGGTREFARGMDGKQKGDPAKAVIAIEKALSAAASPLRLQLGKDAIDGVREHAQNLLAELQKWQQVGTDTAVDHLKKSA